MGQELAEATTSSKQRGGMAIDGGWTNVEGKGRINNPAQAMQWRGVPVIFLMKFGKESEILFSDIGSGQIWERSGEVLTSALLVSRVSIP